MSEKNRDVWLDNALVSNRIREVDIAMLILLI